jgi:hypothetical protein
MKSAKIHFNRSPHAHQHNCTYRKPKQLSIACESVDNHGNGDTMGDLLKLIWYAASFCGGVTAHPNAEWLARQLTEACGWDEPPRYLIRDRDGAYGAAFMRRIRAMAFATDRSRAIALAERICGEADRLDPMGMS